LNREIQSDESTGSFEVNKTSLRKEEQNTANETRVKECGTTPIPTGNTSDVYKVGGGSGRSGLTSQTNLGLLEIAKRDAVQHIAQKDSGDTDPNSIIGEMILGRKDRHPDYETRETSYGDPEKDSEVKLTFGDSVSVNTGDEFPVLGSQSCALGTAYCIKSPHSGWTVESPITTDTSMILRAVPQRRAVPQKPRDVLNKPSLTTIIRGGRTRYTRWSSLSISEGSSILGVLGALQELKQRTQWEPAGRPVTQLHQLTRINPRYFLETNYRTEELIPVRLLRAPAQHLHLHQHLH
jgi:hypothetical protein